MQMSNQINRSKIVLAVAGTEVFNGIAIAFLGFMAANQVEGGSSFGVIIFGICFSLPFVVAGIFLWRYHKAGWILSIIMQILCIPQIKTEGFSWAISVPIHFISKISRGSNYYGLDILALVFAVVLYRSWRAYHSETLKIMDDATSLGIGQSDL